MNVHLIEMPLSIRALHLWAGARKIPADEGLILHHLLGETFGPAVLQPFRLMVAPRAQDGTLYAYAADEADGLRLSAMATLTPANAEVVSLDRMRSLPRAGESWSVGQRLGFDIRLRPVVRLGEPLTGQDESGKEISISKGAEIDAFLASRLRGTQVTREARYIEWLSERLAPAAELDLTATRLASFSRLQVRRNGKKLEGPDAVVHGTLTVTDPLAFSEILARGIGRHRTYGYGMLLLRPPQRSR